METRTLYKMNHTNDISWWTVILDPKDLSVSVTWGHKLPAQGNQNGTRELFGSYEEANKEFYSKIRYQLNRRGYTDDVPTVRPTLPMRCQEYHPGRTSTPIYESFALQPKLDGIRCIMSSEDLITRTNKKITAVPHIELYSHLLPPEIKLDGELYIPNTPMNIVESYVLRQQPDLKVCKEVEYHVFDLVDTEAPFQARMEALVDVVDRLEQKYLKWRTDPSSPYTGHPYFSHKFPIKIVPTVIHDEPTNDSIIQDYFHSCTDNGYEGAIIRNLHGPYEIDKKSRHVLKLKEFFDNEFEIVDVVRGKNDVGVLVCKVNGSTEEFNCLFKGTSAVRKQMLVQKHFFIGKWLRVEHEGLFDNGKPRCPIGIHYFDKQDHD